MRSKQRLVIASAAFRRRFLPRDRLAAPWSQPETEGRPNGVHPTSSSTRTGTTADPRTFRSLPRTSWNAGDTIPLGSERSLRFLGSRLDENLDSDPMPVRVGEPGY